MALRLGLDTSETLRALALLDQYRSPHSGTMCAGKDYGVTVAVTGWVGVAVGVRVTVGD